jgi:hypothetical protein
MGEIFYDFIAHAILEGFFFNLLLETNQDFKILFILDNTPTQTAKIVDISENMKVQFLPPDTKSLLLCERRTRNATYV